MERLDFLVQGSSAEPYRVIIQRSGAKLNGSCTCAAGSNLQSCKHVMRILAGNSEGVVEGEGELALAASWLLGSAVERILSEVSSAERALEAAKTALSRAKKDLSRALYS